MPRGKGGWIFNRPNIRKILKNKKDLVQACILQKRIYDSFNIGKELSIEDLIEISYCCDQIGKVLRKLAKLDIEILQSCFCDFRTLDKSDLELGMNICMSVLMKSLSAKPTLQADSLLLNALAQRGVNVNFIPPLIRQLSEDIFKSANKSDTMNTLSHLHLTACEKTTRKTLKSAPSYKESLDDHKPIVSCIDNIDIHLKVGLHKINKPDSKYYNGRNHVTIQTNITVPEEHMSTARKPISCLKQTFVEPSSEQCEAFKSFKKSFLQRNLDYCKTEATFKKLNKILTAKLEEDTCEPATDKKKKNITYIPSLGVYIGLDPAGKHFDMRSMYQHIENGSITKPENLLKSLNYLVTTYVTINRPIIFIHCDQAIYELYQKHRFDDGFLELESKVSIILEFWHTGWTFDKGIFSAYSEPLRPLLASIGYLAPEHFSYIVKCLNSHRSHYILEDLCIAFSASMFLYFREDNPAIDINDNDIIKYFEEWLSRKSENNCQLKLWLQFVETVILSCANWFAQRTGSTKLYMCTITSKGILPYFFMWNRYNYSHSIMEFLRDIFLSSDYEKYVINSNGSFITYEGGSVSQLAIGEQQEMTIKAIKAQLKHPTHNTIDSMLDSAVANLAPVSINKQSLKHIINSHHNYNHKSRAPDIRCIENFMYCINYFNMLGLRKDIVDNSDVVTECMDDSFTPQCFSPDTDPLFDYSFHSDSGHCMMTDFNSSQEGDDMRINRIVEMITCAAREVSVPITASSDYFKVDNMLEPVIDASKPNDWYSKNAFNPDFLNCYRIGIKQVEEFAKKMIVTQESGDTTKIRSQLSCKERNVPYMKNVKGSNQNQDKVKLSNQELKDSIGEVITPDMNLHPYDLQYSTDGVHRRKPNKDYLKTFLINNFNSCYHESVDEISGEHSVIARDCSPLLTSLLSPSTDVTNHVKILVNKYIIPALNSTKVLVYSFNCDKLLPFIYGQEIYEKSLKKAHCSIPKTARIFELGNGVPLPAFISSCPQTRQDYGRLLFKELFSNPEKYISNESNSFIIIVNGLFYNKGASLPACLQYSSEHKRFITQSTPGLRNDLGLAEDSMFYLVNGSSIESDDLSFVSENSSTILKALAVCHRIFCRNLFVYIYSRKKMQYDIFNITELASLIKEMFSDVKNPVEAFLCLCLDAGYVPYTSALCAVSLQKSLEMFTSNPIHLCDINDHSLPDSVMSEMDLPPDTVLPSPNQFNHLYCNRVLAHHSYMSDYSYEEMYKELFKLQSSAACSLPTNSGFKSHLLRICAAFIHISSLQAVIPNSDIIYQLGFVPVDKSKETSVNNVKMDFNSKADEPTTKCPAKLKSGQNKNKPCGKPIKANGLCTVHYKAMKRRADNMLNDDGKRQVCNSLTREDTL